MKTKINLGNIQGKLSRAEMKNIMAGAALAACKSDCSGACTTGKDTAGTCHANASTGKCYCTSVS